MDAEASTAGLMKNEEHLPDGTQETISEMDIGAFILKGKKIKHRLEIPDLDVLITSHGNRFVPLFRLLEKMKVKKTEENGRVTFQPDGSTPVIIDMEKKEMIMNETTLSVPLIVARADIAMMTDIFLPPSAISKIFSMEVQWDPDAYAFMARTEKMLAIWKRPERKSLLAVETEELVEKLPKLHDAAHPRRQLLSLDFAEVNGQLKYKAVDPFNQGDMVFDSLEQSIWGAFARGRYKFRLSEPTQTYDGTKIESADGPGLMMDWGEWRYARKNTEAVVGDSNFGLNDLIFPTIGMSGLRFNGVGGIDESKMDGDKSDFGTQSKFDAPIRFQGYAPVGSTVELYVNDRRVETEEVKISLPNQPGTGLYRLKT